MKSTILQIPLKKDLREKAQKAAKKQGFSSLQEAVRVFLSQLATKNIEVHFAPPDVPLSQIREKQYSRRVDEVKNKKIKSKTFSDSKSMIEHLNQ